MRKTVSLFFIFAMIIAGCEKASLSQLDSDNGTTMTKSSSEGAMKAPPLIKFCSICAKSCTEHKEICTCDGECTDPSHGFDADCFICGMNCTEDHSIPPTFTCLICGVKGCPPGSHTEITEPIM